MTARPTKLKVGVFVYDIEFNGVELKRLERAGTSDCFGMCFHDQSRILIDDTRPLVATQNTVMHEILHAMLWAYGIPLEEIHKLDNPEEHFIQLADHAFLSLVKDNPELMAWLQDTE